MKTKILGFLIFVCSCILIAGFHTDHETSASILSSPEIEEGHATLLDTTTCQLILRGSFVEIYGEKKIFHSKINNNFFMKFYVKNITDKTVGIDLSNYQKIIYPNQWGVYNTPSRMVIDEMIILPDTIKDTIGILKKYKNGSLTMIKPNEKIEYYRDWNGSGEEVKLKDKKHYLIVSFDGQILTSNGIHVENLSWNITKTSRGDMVFNYPISHLSIPEKALIIADNKK